MDDTQKNHLFARAAERVIQTLAAHFRRVGNLRRAWIAMSRDVISNVYQLHNKQNAWHFVIRSFVDFYAWCS